MKHNNATNNLQKLIDIMAMLRSAEGCQWDRAQTPESLKPHILEEAYELLAAIDSGNPAEICDELGDLLLQVVFQAQIFSEAGDFTLAEVADSISEKLIRRHPHIFADAATEGHEQRWEDIKLLERSSRGLSNKLGKRIPATLPALKRCSKMLKKHPTADILGTVQQMQEQLKDIEAALLSNQPDTQKLAPPLTQLLVNVCVLATTSNLDAEDLLRRKTNQLIAEIDSVNDL